MREHRTFNRDRRVALKPFAFLGVVTSVVPYSFADFLVKVNGKRLLKAFLAAGALVVPAWSDPDDGHRLKMACKKSEALSDPEQVIESCRGRPGAMLVMPPGLAMLDLDVKGKVNGWVWLAQNHPGWIPSRSVVETPSGGAHVFMRAEGVRSRTAHAPGVDVFGPGSVVTMPGSRSPRGRYTPPKDFAFVRAPPEVVASLPQAKPDRGTTRVQRYHGGGPAAVRAFSVFLTRGGADASNISGRLNRQAFLSGLRADEIAIDDLSLLVDIAVEYGMSESDAWNVAERGYTAGESAPRRYKR